MINKDYVARNKNNDRGVSGDTKQDGRNCRIDKNDK